MADLKIPSINKNSDKFFFKKKLILRRKSKRKLIKESFLMFSLGILIIYINYSIPDKKLIFDNFFSNFNKLLKPFLDLFFYIYEIFIAIFIILSLIFALVLIVGAFSRLLKMARRKSRKIPFK